MCSWGGSRPRGGRGGWFVLWAGFLVFSGAGASHRAAPPPGASPAERSRDPRPFLSSPQASLPLPGPSALCVAQAGRWRDKPYGPVASSRASGNYVYYGNGLVFSVLDVSDPAHPSLVLETELPATVDEGEILEEEGYLFVPLTNGTLKIFDLSNPSLPQEVASLGGFSGLRGGMELYGGLLYAADGSGGLRVVSLSPIGTPSIIGSLASSLARDVTLYEKGFTKYAYVADFYDGLLVANVTNPAAPVLLATLPLEEGTEAVARLGTTLFVADGSAALRIFSLANPALPVEVGAFPTTFWPEWLEVQGTTGYLCDGYGGLRILDLSTPESPSLLGSLDTPAYTIHASLAGNLAFLSDYTGGLRIVDVSDPGSPQELSSVDLSEGPTLGLWSDGTLGLACRYGEGLAVFDLSNPGAIAERSLLPLPPVPYDFPILHHVTTSGNTAYVAARGQGLWTADLSDPDAPFWLGHLETGGVCLHVAVQGSLAYVSAARYGLAIVDVSDPAAPVEVGRFNTPGMARWVSLAPPIAYVADTAGGLAIVDVSNPAAPAGLAALSFPDSAYSVDTAGSLACVAAGAAGLRLVDVSNPAAPVEVGFLDTPGSAVDVTLQGSVAFVADWEAGVHVVDVSTPSAPVLLDTFDTPGFAREVRLAADRLYVADTYGFLVLDPSPCFASGVGTFHLLSPAPGATGMPCSLRLQWENAPGAFLYDLYLDTQNPPATLAASGLRAAQWDAAGLDPGTTYYWKVVAVNPGGSTVSEVRSFRTAPLPGPFDLITPLGGEAARIEEILFCWSPSEGATSYRFYLGTADPPPLHSAGLTQTCLEVSGLQPGQTYHWRVVAESPCGEAESATGVGSFSLTCGTFGGLWPQDHSEALYSFALAGSHAYFTNGPRLEAVDLSDPANPVRTATYTLPTRTHEGEPVVFGGFLYLPLLVGQIRVFDLADPGAPRETGVLGGLSSLRGGMEVYENRLYIADEGAGLRIADLSDPARPALLGTFSAPGIRDVALYPDGAALLAYIGGVESPDLQVVDVTDAANPFLVAEVPTAPAGDFPSIEGLVREGDLLFLAGGYWGLRIFRLDDPRHPAPLSVFPVEDYLEWVEVQGNRAYLCDFALGLRILDLSNPENPVEVGYWEAPGEGLGFVKVAGSTAYAATGAAGLRILDVSNPSAVTEIGYYDAFPGWPAAIAAGGQRAFLQMGDGSVQVLDLSAPPAATPMGSLPPTPGGVLRSLTLSGNLLLASEDGDGLRLADVSDPWAPVVLGQYAPGHSVLHAATEGSYAYLASRRWGLDVVDISDPSAPFSVGRYNGDPPEGRVRWTAISWPYAYLADGSGGLRVLDVRDSGNPQEVGAAATPDVAYRVAAMDGYALVACGPAGLRIFDVRDPAAPVEVAAYPSGWSGAVDVSGSVAAVQDGGIVRLLDLSTPSSPVLLASVSPSIGGAGMPVLEGDSLWATQTYGMFREELASCCSGPPGAFSLVYPQDGATVPGGIRLDWSDAPWALRYDVYLDTFSPPTTRVLEGRRLSFGNLGLAPNTTYYWKVVALGPCGQSETPVFSFTTEPYNLAVSLFTDTPDPLLTGQRLHYAVEIENRSPYATTAFADLDLTLPPGMTVTFEAAESHPFWAFNPPGHLHIELGTLGPHTTQSLPAVFTVEGTGTLQAHLAVATLSGEFEPETTDNQADASTLVEPLAVGDRVWRDDNGNGIQDPGEPGLPGVVVRLFDAAFRPAAEALTDTQGRYRFSGLTYGENYFVKFYLPSSDFAFSPRDQGSDDTLDSDAETFAGQTDFFSLESGLDPSRWDCGMVPGASCFPPDEPVYIYSVTRTTDGNNFPVLHFMDPNQPRQVTGYNVYRTHDPSLPHSAWSCVATDVIDMDEGTPNKQWVDTSGEDPPPGYSVWYYQVAAFNHGCPAEGPW